MYFSPQMGIIFTELRASMIFMTTNCRNTSLGSEYKTMCLSKDKQLAPKANNKDNYFELFGRAPLPDKLTFY